MSGANVEAHVGIGLLNALRMCSSNTTFVYDLNVFFAFISLCFCVRWAHMAHNHADTQLLWVCYAKEGKRKVGGKDFRLPWSIVGARTVAFACLLHTFESTNWYEMHSLHHPQTYWLHSPRIQINCCLSIRESWWLTHDLLNWNEPENWQPKTEIESRLCLHYIVYFAPNVMRNWKLYELLSQNKIYNECAMELGVRWKRERNRGVSLNGQCSVCTSIEAWKRNRSFKNTHSAIFINISLWQSGWEEKEKKHEMANTAFNHFK